MTPTSRVIPLLASLILIWPLAAGAQLAKSGPGGQTIGGPAGIKTTGPRDVLIFQSSHNLDVCATIQNKGDADITAVFQTLYQSGNEGEPIPVVVLSAVVPARIATAICNRATGRIVMQCPTLECAFEWRVDQQK